MENTRNRNQSAVGLINLPFQRYNLVVRDPFYAYPDDMLRFLLQEKKFRFVEHLDSELATVEVRTMDILLKVEIDGKPVLIHCEIQTDDSNPNMTRRNVGYMGRCYERYGLPIYSSVIYLRETAGSRDTGGYIQDIPGYRFIVEYQVIRLSKIEGEPILQAKSPGLMPFTPLMKTPEGMSEVEWTKRCVEVTKSLDIDVQLRNNLYHFY